MKTISTSLKKEYLLLLALALIFSTNYSEAQIKHTVQVTNNEFTPDELNISPGDTVEWINSQGFHNVNGSQGTYPDNPESFGNSTGSGWTYSHVFNTAGKYDYRCDPHYTLGMTGKIEVTGNDEDKGHLIVNFTGMGPHVGQTLWISVRDKDSGEEIERKQEDINSEFSVSISGIETDHSYTIKFFADHNGNGSYDAPPTDHAWMLELDNATGADTLNFAHNINFTDIMWENRLAVNFTGMAPHVDQDLWLAVVDKNSGKEIDRVHAVVDEDFTVYAYGIENGMSYNVDFFADHNGNGSYDAPPNDHAWRLELNNVSGDTTLNFAHNINFTDIEWKHFLTVEFSAMTPHVGQMLKLYVVNSTSGSVVDSAMISSISSAEFELKSNSLMKGNSYFINFYADLNLSGSYNAPPVDHAWQLELTNVTGDTTLYFTHNINFTDIFSATSVTDLDTEYLRFYPNPASDFVIIETGDLNPENVSVSIYDITGKLNHVQKTSVNNKVEINVQGLKQGIYFLKIQTADQRKTMKLIKE